MVDIRIDGRSVELLAGSSTELNLVNPHFDYSKIAGSSAKLPSFPNTRHNQNIFGYWEQPQAGAVLSRRTLEQYYNGHLIKEATFVLTEAGPAGYTGQMVELLGEFFGDWQTVLLSELPLGILPLPTPVPAVGMVADGLTSLVFPTIRNPDFYGTNGGAISYMGLVNDYSGGSYGNTAAKPMVPMVVLTWLLKKIAMATNTIIDGEFLTDPAYSKLILYNTRALDGATVVTLAQHLPNMTVPDLILELRKLFNLQLDFDLPARRLTIGFWQNAISKAAVLDWSSKAVGKLLKTPEPNTRLQLGYELDSNDALMKDKPSSMADYLTSGASGGIAPLKSRFSTLLTDTVTGRTKAAQPGITAQFGQLSNTFSPRLLFWNGLVVGEPDASPEKSFRSLYWNGQNGLYENHWKAQEAMRQEQFYGKQSLNLTETDLALLKWDNKVHINGVDYFVLNATVTLPITKPTECLLVAG